VGKSFAIVEGFRPKANGWVSCLQNQMTANHLKFMSRAGFQLIILFYGDMR